MPKHRSILPGFGLTMGYTSLYVSLIVVIPLAGLFLKTSKLTWPQFTAAISHPDVVHSLKLTFGLSLVAAVINIFFGFIAAWSLSRYKFPGKRFFDAIIDLPFALPTAVSGITLATLYSYNERFHGWLGTPWHWFATHANAFLAWIKLPALLAALSVPENY